MVHMSTGLAVMAALLVTYFLNPTAAWVALVAASTLALARHIRQRDDEAEAALQHAEK
jgi:Na+/H+ antiporter NhaD/arsenite permease-like protein